MWEIEIICFKGIKRYLNNILKIFLKCFCCIIGPYIGPVV